MPPLQQLQNKIYKILPELTDTHHYSTRNNLRCKNCGEIDNLENHGKCTKGTRKDMQLHHVLLAVCEYQTLLDSPDGHHSYSDMILMKWDFTLPLSGQSTDCIEFLNNLIK